MHNKIMLSIALGLIGIAVLGIIGVVISVVILLRLEQPLMYIICLFAVLVWIEIYIVLSVFPSIATHRMFKRLLFIGIALCLFTAGVYKLYTMYDDSLIAVNTQDVDLNAYDPFAEHNQLATLSQPSTYQLKTGELPRLDGATALYPVYAAFAQAVYPRQTYDALDSEVMSGGTGSAYQRLIDGNVDMIFAAAPSVGQLQSAESNSIKLYLTPIGQEAFVFFVNTDNPVDHLTSEQVKQIYSGQITNWKQVGGNDEKIAAFQRPEDSGSQAMLRRFMGDRQIMEPKRKMMATGMGGMMERVEDYHNYDDAIGYSFHYFATVMNPEQHIKLLAIDGVYPDQQHIANGTYPLIAPFYAVTAGYQYTGQWESEQAEAKASEAASDKTASTTSPQDDSAATAPTSKDTKSPAHSVPTSSDHALQLPPFQKLRSSNPHLEPLLRWILSPQGQELIQQTGYFPLDSSSYSTR
ncbi:PstS family phosphate ABC transporter substrate-binding protein [Paenibacillus kandeliae]|uniref:PstS family phosphate ABC transporter substrate-binding protein n=1 Tax=Paenibacillus kandeliae TaxID=3231269 RepID=UPI00345788B1